MGFDEHNKITPQYCNSTVPLFSELLEMYDSLQIPFFQSSIDEADEQAENITDSIGRDQVIEVSKIFLNLLLLILLILVLIC